MPKKQLATRPSNKLVSLAIADFAKKTLRLQEGPHITMWRDLRNSFNQKSSPACHVWRSDNGTVHHDLSIYMKDVIAILKRDLQLTIVPVNNMIRKYADHGSRPARDDTKRTDDFYRRCRPGPHAPTFGFASFPKDCEPDHPLILNQLNVESNDAINRLDTTVKAIEIAKHYKVISNEEHQKILDRFFPPKSLETPSANGD